MAKKAPCRNMQNGCVRYVYPPSSYCIQCRPPEEWVEERDVLMQDIHLMKDQISKIIRAQDAEDHAILKQGRMDWEAQDPVSKKEAVAMVQAREGELIGREIPAMDAKLSEEFRLMPKRTLVAMPPSDWDLSLPHEKFITLEIHGSRIYCMIGRPTEVPEAFYDLYMSRIQAKQEAAEFEAVALVDEEPVSSQKSIPMGESVTAGMPSVQTLEKALHASRNRQGSPD